MGERQQIIFFSENVLLKVLSIEVCGRGGGVNQVGGKLVLENERDNLTGHKKTNLWFSFMVER